MNLSGMLEECRAIVFDLDDTLYAQVDFKRSGLGVVANHLAGRQLADAALALASLERQMAVLGPSHPRILDAAVAELDLAGIGVDELVDVFRTHQPSIRPFPGVVELLQDLRRRYRLGLLTDGLADVQRRKVHALRLEGYFDAMLFSDEMDTHKPDQALFAWFEQQFELAGRQLAYVADNPAKDFIGANERGWCTVRVLSGEHADSVAQAAGYDAEQRVQSITDLRAFARFSRPRAGLY